MSSETDQSYKALRPDRRKWLPVALLIAFLVAAVILSIVLFGGDTPLPAVHEPDAAALAFAPEVVTRGDLGPADATDATATDGRQMTRKPTRKISERELRALQLRHRGPINYCYHKAAGRAPSVVAKKSPVEVRLAAGGRIERVTVDTKGDRELANCLERVIRAWHFSRTLRQQKVRFSIVFAR